MVLTSCTSAAAATRTCSWSLVRARTAKKTTIRRTAKPLQIHSRTVCFLLDSFSQPETVYRTQKPAKGAKTVRRREMQSVIAEGLTSNPCFPNWKSDTWPRTIETMASEPRYTDDHAKAGLDFSFPPSKRGKTSFPATKSLSTTRSLPPSVPKPACPTSASSPSATCPPALPRTEIAQEYLFSYRNLGIFQENIVNQVLEDVVKACDPVWPWFEANSSARRHRHDRRSALATTRKVDAHRHPTCAPSHQPAVATLSLLIASTCSTTLTLYPARRTLAGQERVSRHRSPDGRAYHRPVHLLHACRAVVRLAGRPFE